MSTAGKVLTIIVVVLLIGAIFYFSCTPSGVAAWNGWFSQVKKTDLNTKYSSLKTVEDTCRSMIASYVANKSTYEQYKDSTDDFGKQLAAEAKIQCNRTASTYNEYMRKNSFMWEGNIPADIDEELPMIK